MAVSLLAYFCSMVSAFLLLTTVWIGLIGASPFQKVHFQPYPSATVQATAPDIDTVAAADTDSDSAAATKPDEPKPADAGKTKVEVATSDSAGYCAARFRSYNPATGTYLGFDGVTHSCP